MSQDEQQSNGQDDSSRLEIDYPCEWEFKIIGDDEDDMRRVVTEILTTREYVLESSNTSREGRFKSMLLRTSVSSDEDRHGIFHRLQESSSVRMVL